MEEGKIDRLNLKAPLIALILLLVLTAAVVEAKFNPSEKQEILAAQNRYRAEVNVSGLNWSENLSLQAQLCADFNAANYLPHNQQKHCPTPGCGQNIARASSNLHFNLTQLVDLWGNEKSYFLNGLYPSVSSTGSPGAVSHYTQMIWQGTNEVGCGKANSSGYDILVCDYSPRGNVEGTAVYSPPRPATFEVGAATEPGQSAGGQESTGKDNSAMARRNIIIGTVFDRPVSCYGPSRV